MRNRAPDGAQRASSSSDRVAAESGLSRVLVLCPFVPYPLDSGGKQRMFALLDSLRADHAVDVLTFVTGEDAAASDALRALGFRVFSVPAPRRSVALAQALIRRTSVYNARHWSPAFRRKLEDLQDAYEYDAVQCEYAYMGQYLAFVDPATPTTLDEHNVEFRLMASMLTAAPNRSLRSLAYRAYGNRELRLREKEEVLACLQADRVLAVSESERAVLASRVGDSRVVVVPNGVNPGEMLAPATSSPPPVGMFVGELAYRPNAEAVDWFVDAILPLVRAELPDFVLRVVGPNNTRDALASRPGVEVVGRVEDVRAELEKATVVVVPLRAGAGTRLKVLEAFAAGRPVVSTTIGADGLGAAPEVHIRIADTPASFAAAIIELARDSSLAERIASAAREHVLAHFTWTDSGMRLNASYANLRSPASLPSTSRTPVSVVLTVMNEAGGLEDLVARLLGQTLQPDEVVIVDGGSTDGTRDALRRLAARHDRVLPIFAPPGTNISQGRNIGLRESRFPIIAVTDAGTTTRVNWLEQLVAPLHENPDIDVVSGFFEPGGSTLFEQTLACVTTPHISEIAPEKFLPSSRSLAFRRAVLDVVPGYPEALTHCEDLVFDLALLDTGATMRFAPKAVVSWQPRPTLRAFFKQYRLYARGDAHAGLWPRRHLLRFGFYGFLTFSAVSRSRALKNVSALAFLLYLRQPFLRLLTHAPFNKRWKLFPALALAPAIVVTGDAAKLVGYACGRPARRDPWSACGDPEAGP